ncbi:MAG: type-F conjugative transfer system pilin assembly protein TrbC [Gammaproteobacteria bacterium]|nr:type-F conjugative transfer system pilin assembly protein TrbC [Gammaproteobacteria bacterium]
MFKNILQHTFLLSLFVNLLLLEHSWGQIHAIETGKPASWSATLKDLDLNQLAKTLTHRPQLLVFVSWSMPTSSLQHLFLDAHKSGAILIWRGLKFGLDKSQDALRLFEGLTPIPEMRIHPELFAQYQVHQVPTFIYVEPSLENNCHSSVCSNILAKVAGDVTLKYAVEWMSLHYPKQKSSLKHYLTLL